MMKKVNWNPAGSRRNLKATVGCVSMYCGKYYSNRKKAKPYWIATITIRKQWGTFRIGPIQKSMAKAQENAVQMAREMLFEYQSCVDAELKNWE